MQLRCYKIVPVNKHILQMKIVELGQVRVSVISQRSIRRLPVVLFVPSLRLGGLDVTKVVPFQKKLDGDVSRSGI